MDLCGMRHLKNILIFYLIKNDLSHINNGFLPNNSKSGMNGVFMC